ncbi:ELMO domain-containing protein 3-like isoform X1 [Branchiostoma floridae]|uniref:ELMO domain-containing protein 3-like isoform X1 n=1 Tax=Branchiostoma floridae TaxID=7739 RepID=A0A9J7KYX4_BRAFL|nr:ELMO domain-containing protein 3-like isoform X1 [Branchiostoma floridae]XP_035672541.1 ELMO domain-containing protein 3-like isoform X1 [Branchiostoma floridae]
MTEVEKTVAANSPAPGALTGSAAIHPGKSPLMVLQANGLLSDFNKPVQEKEVSEDVLRAQEEWDAVETVQPENQSEGTGSLQNQSSLISFNEALAFFQTKDLSEYMMKIKPTVQRSGFTALCHWLFGPPRLQHSLHEERNLVFAMGLYPFDNTEETHMRVLQTVYKRLTGTKLDCPRYGGHWEQIGFQGSDPATDLRGTGFLGLMQVLYFVMEPRTLSLARDIYKLSLHETQNFPFCVMSINITRIALQALREGNLSKECNRRQQIIAVINDFYVATFFHLYQIWKSQHKTIADSGYVIQDVTTFVNKNPRAVIRELERYLSEKRANAIGQMDSPRGVSAGKDSFVGVCDLEPEEEEVDLV